MKNNLELVIEYLQTEYNHLKSSMDLCIEEWDFEGAEAFRKPVIHTRHKLNVLKNLSNPLLGKITYLEKTIEVVKKMMRNKEYFDNITEEEKRKEELKRLFPRMYQRLEHGKAELEKLNSTPIIPRIDDDKILELLDSLSSGEIDKIEFEVKRNKIYLTLSIDKEVAVFQFSTLQEHVLESFITTPSHISLKRLGYSTEDYRKEIPNFDKVNKLKILEELAIIYFEIFGVFGEQVNLKIEYIRTN